MGGVSIIYHKNIKITATIKDQAHETIMIKIELNNTSKLNLICTYYPPNYAYNLDFLDKAINPNENTLIMGDFNAKSHIWHCENQFNRGKELEEIIENNNLCVINEQRPTYDSGKVIDIILSDPELYSKI